MASDDRFTVTISFPVIPQDARHDPGDASVLIVDDEPPARARLRQLLEDIDGFSIAGEASHGTEALELCDRLQPDVVLLDIRMPGLDGLEVAGHLAAWERKPAVVFTTAYDEYAMQAFDAQAIGYLLKPVRRERLEQTLAHAARVSRAQLVQLPGAQPRRHICVNRARGVQLIPVEEIVCFRADQKYVTVQHVGEHVSGEALLDEPLKEIEAEFGERFLRIHRNALVAVAFLGGLERSDDGYWRIRLKDDVLPPLQVSRRHVAEVRRRLRSLP